MIDDSGDNELSPDEAAAFAALPRTSGPDRFAEERTVRALHDRGLLAPIARGPMRRSLIIGLGVAAGLLLFAAGTVVGKRLAERETHAGSTSIEVQQAGTAYVDALVRLSKAGDAAHAPSLVAGLEAGTATLRAAATRLAAIEPDDPTVRRIRTSLDAATGARDEPVHVADDRTVIWF